MLFKKRPTPPERHARISQPANRTGAVFSYHANRSVREGAVNRDAKASEQLNASRAAPRNRYKRLVSIGILVFIALIAIASLRLNDNAKVVPLNSENGQAFLREANVYESAVRNAFSTFFNGNKLTVNTGKIAADLQREFPELKAVSIRLPFIGSRPTVYIQPTEPRLILVSSEGMFVLDSNGRALITGNQVVRLNELEIPLVTDQSNIKIEVGRVVLPRDTVAFITEVAGQFKAKDLSITGMTLPPSTNELHVRFSGAGYAVKFNLHGNAKEEAGVFLATKERLDRERKTPREYIDVRVENRAYYK